MPQGRPARLIRLRLAAPSPSSGWEASFGAAGFSDSFGSAPPASFVANFDSEPPAPPPAQPPTQSPAPPSDDEFGEFSCGSEGDLSSRREMSSRRSDRDSAFGTFEGADAAADDDDEFGAFSETPQPTVRMRPCLECALISRVNDHAAGDERGASFPHVKL